MLKRILSTCLLWAIVLACLWYFGATGAVWLVGLIAVLTLREFYVMIARTGVDPFDRLGMLLAAAITVGPLYLKAPADASVWLAVAVIAFSVRILGEREPHNRVETLAWSLFGLLYIPYMLHFIVRIILMDAPHPRTGLVLGVWLIAVSKFCDVGALLSGMAFGRHRMAPQISPKKTWEGFAGGLLTSALIGAGIAWLGRNYVPAGFTPWLAAAIAVPVAAIAAVSDLVESIIKRRAEMKDSGTTIPGIGGMFDLTDSLILAAPLAYVVFDLLGP
ncbi:MAG: phosphatidate cytidylyltransferase [Opitutaceae bacterium]|nr:phosphatidate cytidylyltransferase [Opitutaceae bacterium]